MTVAVAIGIRVPRHRVGSGGLIDLSIAVFIHWRVGALGADLVSSRTDIGRCVIAVFGIAYPRIRAAVVARTALDERVAVAVAIGIGVEQDASDGRLVLASPSQSSS